ncbi:MAG TPA: DMT family transporter [Treponemataceae bacterium]|nr:MAG: EamA-like transporter family protein [bacterium ADurb.Bin374]HPO03124.1 DMT family transporter [Treponemataceae bacterium]
MTYIGEIAALGTALSWTLAALFMENAVSRVGVLPVNTLKVAFGTLYLALVSFALTGHFLPQGVAASSWLFLGASGFVGFVIGDYFLLNAYVYIGSATAMLLMSLSVPLTAAAAFLLYGERLGPWSLAGMALCVSGISVTIAGGRARNAPQNESSAERRFYVKGVAFGVLSAVSMATGTLLTKAGAAGVDSVAATQIRIGSAFAGFFLVAAFSRKLCDVRAAILDRKALGIISLGAVFGPFIGVGLLLFAIQHAGAGIVSTLSSLSPVFLLPPTAFILKRKVTAPQAGGAVLAMLGLALIFR